MPDLLTNFFWKKSYKKTLGTLPRLFAKEKQTFAFWLIAEAKQIKVNFKQGVLTPCFCYLERDM